MSQFSKLIIHGGMHKTGSSSIQSYGALNKKKLLAYNIYFLGGNAPGTPNPGNAGNFFS